MAVRAVPASQLHHMVSSGEAIQIQAGVVPNRRFAVMWPLSVVLEDRQGKTIGDHYLYDGVNWFVGSREELTKHFEER